MFRDYISGQGNENDYALSAAEHIDTLTLFRIHDFERLTDFQQRIVTIVHKRLENFERENEDVLDSLLTSYSVNGVSMSFGDKVKSVGGVVIPAELYTMLCSTGLCYPAV